MENFWSQTPSFPQHGQNVGTCPRSISPLWKRSATNWPAVSRWNGGLRPWWGGKGNITVPPSVTLYRVKLQPGFPPQPRALVLLVSKQRLIVERTSWEQRLIWRINSDSFAIKPPSSVWTISPLLFYFLFSLSQTHNSTIKRILSVWKGLTWAPGSVTK